MISERRRRARRVLLGTGSAALAVALAGFLIGVGWVQCLLLATVVTAVGAATLALNGVDDEPALPVLDESGGLAGARREVSRLSWVMGGPGDRVGGAPYRLLRAIAVDRLALRGVDVTDAEGDRTARDLLGAEGYAHLIAETSGTPTRREFEACVTLLERLDPRADAPTPIRRSSTP